MQFSKMEWLQVYTGEIGTKTCPRGVLITGSHFFMGGERDTAGRPGWQSKEHKQHCLGSLQAVFF